MEWFIPGGRQASLYAASGIPDYWIVNLRDVVLEVFRSPVPDASQSFGSRYADVQTLQRGTDVRPLSALNVASPVADLLP